MALSLTKKEPVAHFLQTGIGLFNLAISDRVDGGYPVGKYTFIVGDSGSGKSFLIMNAFAEAAIDPYFDDYDFILDNTEDGMDMDVARLFGLNVLERVQPPSRTRDGDPKHSETVEQFYDHLDNRFKAGRKFIYVLDSMDPLETEADQEKFEQHKKARAAGKEAPGTFGMDKAKKNSVGLRRVVRQLRDSGSILLIISQTRDNTQVMGYGPKKTRSGGRALRFYAHLEVWTEQHEKIKKTIAGKIRKIGQKIGIRIEKNRVTGKLHEVETSIYPSYGIDCNGTSIDFLADEGWAKRRKAKTGEGGDKEAKGGRGYNTRRAGGAMLDIPKLGEGSREKLLTMADDPYNREILLGQLQKCWNKIEAGKRLNRKARYS